VEYLNSESPNALKFSKVMEDYEVADFLSKVRFVITALIFLKPYVLFQNGYASEFQ
jgi:hypothetical protein